MYYLQIISLCTQYEINNMKKMKITNFASLTMDLHDRKRYKSFRMYLSIHHKCRFRASSHFVSVKYEKFAYPS